MFREVFDGTCDTHKKLSDLNILGADNKVSVILKLHVEAVKVKRADVKWLYQNLSGKKDIFFLYNSDTRDKEDDMNEAGSTHGRLQKFAV